MNSVAKYPEDDYLVSIRYNNAIYRISRTGDVVWCLGGKSSDFVQDFNFSGQHDARVVSKNKTVTILSLFDNASTNMHQFRDTALASSFKVVALYENDTPRRAVVSLPLYTAIYGGRLFA